MIQSGSLLVEKKPINNRMSTKNRTVIHNAFSITNNNGISIQNNFRFRMTLKRKKPLD